jgi:hypothetical protein
MFLPWLSISTVDILSALQQRGRGRGADRKGERGEETGKTKDEGKQSSRRRQR